MSAKKQTSLAQHWDDIYHRPEKEWSWHELVPVTSISLIDQAGLPKDAPIIDVGGGDGTLARHLLVQGYEDITVLDISARALEIGQKRLGDLSSRIRWIHINILDFEPARPYALWHDRAAFHFLVQREEQLAYARKAYHSLQTAGVFILGTFSERGPVQCSGLPVQHYSEASVTALIRSLFKRNKTILRQHITPFHTLQEYLYTRFTKL
jgi:SAM-dependent methyltransferase